MAAVMLIALMVLIPRQHQALAPIPLVKKEHQLMHWLLLALLYGLAGFGYIIVATYLPLMAKDAGSPLLTAHLWTLVGVSVVPVVGCQALGRSALPERKPVGTRDLCVANTCQRFSHLIDFKQYWLWWHVYGHHIAGHDSGSSVECARQD